MLEAWAVDVDLQHGSNVVIQGFMKCVALCQHVADPLPHLPLDLFDVPFEQSDNQSFLAGEVLVEGPDGNPRTFRNPVCGASRVAMGFENLSRRFQNRLDGGLGTPLNWRFSWL